ncbi:MAG TPA: hypothetical protein VFD55_01690 [Candidatus Angelobacter sp.]|nr:hypothetical protein [Candidatus Angelobacter sp.]
MTREEYKGTLLNRGFRFAKTTLSYPGWRGDEDIYTHKPEYKYTFRVFRISKDKPDYGLYVGVGDQFRKLDAIVEHNVDISGTNKYKLIPVWTDDTFIELMRFFDSDADKNREWSNEDADELITVILPTINNG